MISPFPFKDDRLNFSPALISSIPLAETSTFQQYIVHIHFHFTVNNLRILFTSQ